MSHLQHAITVLVASTVLTNPAFDLWAEERSVGRIEVSAKWVPGPATGSAQIVLDVVLINDTKSPLFFSEQSPDWDYQLEIVGPDGSPPRLTNFGVCVLPAPSEIFRNIGRELGPGERDHIESIQLGRLYHLDRVGQYRVVLRRRVWQIKLAFSSLPREQLAEKCGQLCYGDAKAVSNALSFALSSVHPDVSPEADPTRCR